MLKINKFTLSQLLLAAGIIKKAKRSGLVAEVGVSESYFTKLSKNANFKELVNMMRVMPLDKDMEVYDGIKTLYKIVGKFIYTVGEKE